MENKEIWKEVKGFNKKYTISNFGRLYSFFSNKIIIQKDNGNGYCIVNLYKNKKPKTYYIHRLSAIAFLKNPEKKQQVNHKDCNKQNNNIENLEWATTKENMTHAKKNNRFYTSEYQKMQTSLANTGEKSGMAKLKNNEVFLIKKHLKENIKTQKEIALIFNTTRSNISSIKRQKSWKHILI